MSGDASSHQILKNDVLLLNNEIITCAYSSRETGENILNKICSYLKINEPFHFGMKFKDNHGSVKWLNRQTFVALQVSSEDMVFHFQVQFYPMCPNDICDVHTRHNLYLQLRRDFHERNFIFPSSIEIFLTALLMQLDYGNKCDSEESNLSEEVKKLHEKMKGISAFEAQECFLVTIGNIDAYGMEIHEVRDEENNACHIGANFGGVSIFKNRKLIDIFNWSDVDKFLWEDHTFVLVLNDNNAVKFNCGVKGRSFYIWKQVMDHLIHFCITNEDREMQLSGVRDVLNDFGDAPSASTLFTDKSIKPLNKAIENFFWDLEKNIEKDKSVISSSKTSISNINSNQNRKYQCKDLINDTSMYLTFFIIIIVFALKSDLTFLLDRILEK